MTRTRPELPARIAFDLLVVGSGASGLAAAVTAAHHGLNVVVVEKDPVFGGATAWSGGWMWVPCNPLARRAVGPMTGRLLTTMRETSFMGMPIMAGAHLGAFLSLTRSLESLRHLAWRTGRHLVDLALHGRAMQLVNGVALVARLAKSAEDLGVRLFESAPARRLPVDQGEVRGAVVATGSGEVEIHAARGVVPAAGGLPHDLQRRKALFPRTPTGREHLALPPPGCSGDGITLGLSAGGSLVTDLASPVAWAPVSRVPYGQEVASWRVCDHRFQRRYGLGFAKRFPLPLAPCLRSGYLKRGTSLDALARACGIAPAGLKASPAETARH